MENKKKIDALSIVLECQSGSTDETMWKKLSEILLKLTNFLPCSCLLTIHDREDIVQDLIMSIYSGTISPCASGNRFINVKKYLLGHLQNKSRSYLKERSVNFLNISADYFESEFSLEEYDFYYDLDRMLASLGENEKKIIIERVINLTSYREIGSVCSLKIGKTKAKSICENFGKEFLLHMG